MKRRAQSTQPKRLTDCYKKKKGKENEILSICTKNAFEDKISYDDHRMTINGKKNKQQAKENRIALTCIMLL